MKPEEIKQAIKTSGLKQNFIAGFLGVSPGTVSQWKSGILIMSEKYIQPFKKIVKLK